MKHEYASKHFKIHEICEGVYVALGTIGDKPQLANSGIIDLGRKSLIFDSGLTP